MEKREVESRLIPQKFADRIFRVKQQLSKLSSLVSNSNKFDSFCLRELLNNNNHCSSSDSQDLSCNLAQQLMSENNLLTHNNQSDLSYINVDSAASQSVPPANLESSSSLNYFSHEESSSQSNQTIHKLIAPMSFKQEEQTICIRTVLPQNVTRYPMEPHRMDKKHPNIQSSNPKRSASPKIHNDIPLKNLLIQSSLSSNQLLSHVYPQTAFKSTTQKAQLKSSNSSVTPTLSNIKSLNTINVKNTSGRPVRPDLNVKILQNANTRTTKRLNSPVPLLPQQRTRHNLEPPVRGIKRSISKQKRGSSSNIQGFINPPYNDLQGQAGNNRSPKLNKVSVKKLKDNIVMRKMQGVTSNQPKATSTALEKGLLDEKLHLNLSEHKPLMQRILEKRKFTYEYTEETKKYEDSVKSCIQKSIQDAGTQNYPLQYQMAALLVNFTAQFSKAIDKRLITAQLSHSPPDYLCMLPDLKKVLIGLPGRLFKKNIVSEYRYQSLRNGYQQLWSAFKQQYIKKLSKFWLFRLLQSVHNYIEFLASHRLIESTERKNIYTARSNIMQYYSHRSEKEYTNKHQRPNKVLVEEVAAQKHQNASGFKSPKKASKQYDTERRPAEDEDSSSRRKNAKKRLMEMLPQQNKVMDNKLDFLKKKQMELSPFSKQVIHNWEDSTNLQSKPQQLSTRSGKYQQRETRKTKTNKLEGALSPKK